MSKKAMPQVDENGKVFGNKDEHQRYPFPIGWMGMIVVSQYNAATLPSGAIVPDEPTRRTMSYEPFVFEKLQKDGGFGDLQYIILHDPR